MVPAPTTPTVCIFMKTASAENSKVYHFGSIRRSSRNRETKTKKGMRSGSLACRYLRRLRRRLRDFLPGVRVQDHDTISANLAEVEHLSKRVGQRVERPASNPRPIQPVVFDETNDRAL